MQITIPACSPSFLNAICHSFTILSNSYGRYVVTETDKTGTFVVCVPGVAFHMPMWGYVLVLVGAVVIVGGGGVTILLIARRKKQKQK